MARRGSSGGGMDSGPMNTIIAGFVGLLVIVAIIILGPVLAGSIDDAVPTFGTCSYVNATDTYTYYGDCGSANTTHTELIYTTPYSESSYWNTEYNSDMPNGESLWTTNVVIGGVVVLVFFIALAIYYIRVIA